MPVALNNTTVADQYPVSGGAQFGGTDIFASGWFIVATNGVIAQYIYGLQGQYKESPELFLAPGMYPMQASQENPVNGIKFRNSIAGSNAQVFGVMFYKDDTLIFPEGQFTSTITPGGGVTPGGGGIQQITSSDGSITVTNPTGPITDLKSLLNALAIKFNTSPQVSPGPANTGFLEVKTNGNGINITDSGTGLGNGIYINSDDGAGSGGFIEIGTDQGELVLPNNVVSVKLNGVGASFFTVGDSGGTQQFKVYPDGSFFDDINAAGFFTVRIRAGTMVTIEDETSAPIFEVRHDGSIHGRAAVGAITWDL